MVLVTDVGLIRVKNVSKIVVFDEVCFCLNIKDVNFAWIWRSFDIAKLNKSDSNGLRKKVSAHV